MATLERNSKIENGEPLDESVKLSYTKPPYEGAEIAFVDVETTGLQPESCNITEISVQIYKQGKGIVNSYTSLVRLGKPLRADIVRLTGITDELLASAPPFPKCYRLRWQSSASEQSLHSMPSLTCALSKQRQNV